MAGILELLSEIGEDNISVQALHSCLEKSQLGNKTSKLTIVTDALTTADSTIKHGEVRLGKTALICWVDSAKFDETLKKLT